MHYDLDTPTSFIICAPKGIPDPIMEILEKTLMDGMKQETFRKVAKDQELLLTEPLTGKALNDYLKKCYLLYEKFIRDAGIYKTGKK
jgi:tripartite-type tricarboxylate transporter receptor subunit TctC